MGQLEKGYLFEGRVQGEDEKMDGIRNEKGEKKI